MSPIHPHEYCVKNFLAKSCLVTKLKVAYIYFFKGFSWYEAYSFLRGTDLADKTSVKTAYLDPEKTGYKKVKKQKIF